MGRLIYRSEKLPKLDSEYMMGLARRLMDTKRYWHDARRPLESVWKECDDAYLCYRELPVSEGMPWVDTSDYGETIIFDSVNQLASSLSLAMFPKDNSWLTVVAKKTDSVALVKQIQGHQTWMHRKARSRRSWARNLKQLIVRGTSSMFMRWDNVYRYKRLTGIESIVELGKQLGMTPEEARVIGRVRQPELLFNGPVARPLDAYDLFLDPEADLTCDRRVGYIVQTFRRDADIKNEVDDDEEPVYQNLKDLEPWRAEEIYHMDTDGQNRLRSLNTMGVYPQNSADNGTRLIPIYIFHLPYYEYEGIEYFDTYFHVALSREGNQPRIIKIEENPSDQGHSSIIIDNYIDWFTNAAYGISGVEKQISAYRQLNVLSAVLLQAMITTTFPPYLMEGGIIKDDQGLPIAPGTLIEVAMSGLGLDFIKPLPTPERGVQLGMQDFRFYGQKISDGFGSMGGYSDDPTRTLSTRETATSVNMRATSGSRTIDDQSEKFSDSVQDYAQWFYDMSRQKLVPNGDMLEYAKMNAGGQMRIDEINFGDFDQDRDIQVLGLHGVTNKVQEIQELREALGIIGQAAPSLPNAPILAQKVALQLLARLNVEVPPEAELSPQELAAIDPQVQQMALGIAMKSPEFQQMMMGGAPMPPMQGGRNGSRIRTEGS